MTPTHHGVTIQKLLAAGLLTPDDQLTSTDGAWPAQAHIDDTGNVVYQRSGRLSPSVGGRAVKCGKSTTGWDCRAIQDPTGSVRLSTRRARYPKTKETT